MEHLNGPFLFDSMYAEDVEGSQLSYLPGVGELVQTYPSGSRPPPGPGRGSPGGSLSTQGLENQVGCERRDTRVSGQQGPGWQRWRLADRVCDSDPHYLVCGLLLCALHAAFKTVSTTPWGGCYTGPQLPSHSWGS